MRLPRVCRVPSIHCTFFRSFFFFFVFGSSSPGSASASAFLSFFFFSTTAESPCKTRCTASGDASSLLVAASWSFTKNPLVFSGSNPHTILLAETSRRSARANETQLIILLRKSSFACLSPMLSASCSEELYRPSPKLVARITSEMTACKKRKGGFFKHLPVSVGRVMRLPRVCRVPSIHCTFFRSFFFFFVFGSSSPGSASASASAFFLFCCFFFDSSSPGPASASAFFVFFFFFDSSCPGAVSESAFFVLFFFFVFGSPSPGSASASASNFFFLVLCLLFFFFFSTTAESPCKTRCTASGDASSLLVAASWSFTKNPLVFSGSNPHTILLAETSRRSARANETQLIILLRKSSFACLSPMVPASCSEELYRPSPKPVARITSEMTSCKKRKGGFFKYPM